MKCLKAIYERRSIRKFKRESIPIEILKKIVECGSMAASGSNKQPLKYIIVNSNEKTSQVFKHTRWAGYLKGKGSPSFKERPAAFILVYNDNDIRNDGYQLDAGAAIQNILLSAYAHGLATCWLGSIDRKEICEIVASDDKYELISAVAVGYPDQISVTEQNKGDIKYYLDKQGVLHVPKRGEDEIILSIC